MLRFHDVRVCLPFSIICWILILTTPSSLEYKQFFVFDDLKYKQMLLLLSYLPKLLFNYYFYFLSNNSSIFMKQVLTTGNLENTIAFSLLFEN